MRQPAVPRCDDVRRRSRLGLQCGGVADDHRPVHRTRWQLHRHRELLHEEPLREDHRRSRRPSCCPARPAQSSRPQFSTAISTTGDPNGGGSGLQVRSSQRARTRCDALQGTDYIDLYWLHNWDVHTPIDETMARLEDLVRAGKDSATWASPTRPRGRLPKPTSRPDSGAGPHSSAFRSSTRCSSEASNKSWFRWRSSSV